MSEPHARPLDGRLLHGSALSLGSTLAARGLAVAQSVVVARALDPHAVGVFSIVSYVLGLVAAFADLGLPTAAAKLIAETRGAARAALLPVVA
ncbi:MAG: oligosaccharide flippase family protein, partial [Candidatus Rokubacteria bacterium]|nr:oligosaccharide flippase family protein [Candidatus Rokubacteria bacterium]